MSFPFPPPIKMLEQYHRNKAYLERSKFRSSFKLNEGDISYINKIGLEKMREHAVDFIIKRLAPAKPYKDGKQTPYRGHPVFKAQHALAFCCRSCLQKWWKIPKGRQLTQEEINGLVSVIMQWVVSQHKPLQLHQVSLLENNPVS